MWQWNNSGMEIYHWGIKGMKWGVRRYQNKDGTLTPAGICCGSVCSSPCYRH